MIAVVPTILVPDRQAYDRRLAALKAHFVRAHLDVLNDTLVSGKSFCNSAYIGTRAVGLQFEVHVMVDCKNYNLAQWNQPWVEKIIVHAEASGADSCLASAHGWGKRVFVALNPGTDPQVITRFRSNVDGVMVMTVEPGRNAAPFQAQMLDVIKKIRSEHPLLELEADGGVSNETVQALLDVGITTVAVGSYLHNDRVEERLLDLIGIIEHFEASRARK